MSAKEMPFKTPVRVDVFGILDAEKKIIGDWWKAPTQVHCDYIAAAINSYAKRDEALKLAMEALEKIACFNDVGATEILIRTGRYSSFDEPSSVEESRYAISAINELLK